MSRLIIAGDSNVYRNLSASRAAEKTSCRTAIHKITRKQTFELLIKELRPEPGTMLVSVISNIICDLLGPNPPTDDSLNAAVVRFVDLMIPIQKLPLRVLIVPPIPRKVPSWFNERIPKMTTFLEQSLQGISSFCLAPPFAPDALVLLDDGVHLDEYTGARFAEYLISLIQDFNQIAETAAPQPKPSDKEATSSDVMALIKESVLPRLDTLPLVQTKV